MNKSPTKDMKPRPSAGYDADLRQKFQHVRTEEHQMTAARVSVQKGVPHADQMEAEELLKKTKRELEHWETPEDTPTPSDQDKQAMSHAIDVQIPDFSDIKVDATQDFKPPVIVKKLMDAKVDSDKNAQFTVVFHGMPEPEIMWFLNGNELSASDRVYWKFLDNHTCQLNINNVTKADEGQYAARVANRGGEELTTCVVTVNEIKRKILEGPRSQEWNADLTARFEVVVSHKDVNGVWYKDGVEIEQSNKCSSEDLGSGRRRLTISDLKKVDEGIYEYVYAGDRAAATLAVHAKPITIVEPLVNQVVMDKEVATFDCALSDVTSDGRWYKNGQEIQQSERFFIVADKQRQMLIIEDVCADDIGEYAFAIDEDHTVAVLALQEGVQIVEHLQAASCIEGVDAEFVCAVEPEEYSNGKWFHNGVELVLNQPRYTYDQTEGGFKKLKIRNVCASDNGIYTFVAGESETVAELNVEEISVEEPLKNQQVDAGGEVLFETLLSHANVQGIWYKNNEPFMLTDKSQVFIDAHVQALYIRELNAQDAGIYSFRAGDKITECELEVASYTDIFKMGLHDLHHKSKETAVFHVELNQQADGAWFKDGQQVQENSRIRIADSDLHRELIISEVSPADEGVYTYSTGNAETSATLFVEVAFIIPKNFKDLHIQETQSVEFECEVTRENLETHWFKDGIEIDPSTNERYEITVEGLSYKLRIRNCNASDNCEIVFLAEDESIAAQLQVEPIDIVEDIKDAVHSEGNDCTFMCRTSSAATPRWSKDNVVLKPRENKYILRQDGCMNYLTVKNVTMQDAGTYTCHIGNSETSATMFVEVAQVNFVSNTSIQVQASTSSQDSAAIEFEVSKLGVNGKWFHNGIEVELNSAKYNYVVDRTYHKLIVKQLNVSDAGDYSFQIGANQVATAQLFVQAAEVAPQWLRQMQNVKTDLTGNARFEVEVTGSPTPTVTFYQNGTQINSSPKYNLSSSGNIYRLDINCCTEVDVCQYTCTAKNNAGSVMSSAQLSIVEAYQYEEECEQQQGKCSLIIKNNPFHKLIHTNISIIPIFDIQPFWATVTQEQL